MQRFQPSAQPSAAAPDAVTQSGPLPDCACPALSPRGERARSVSGGGVSRPAAGGRDKYDFSHLSAREIEQELANLKCAHTRRQREAAEGSGREGVP